MDDRHPIPDTDTDSRIQGTQGGAGRGRDGGVSNGTPAVSGVYLAVHPSPNESSNITADQIKRSDTRLDSRISTLHLLCSAPAACSPHFACLRTGHGGN